MPETDQRLALAQELLEQGDIAGARTIVDAELEKDAKNSRALALDEALAREGAARVRARQEVDDASLAFETLPGQGKAIIVIAIILGAGLAILFGARSLIEMNADRKARPAASASPRR